MCLSECFSTLSGQNIRNTCSFHDRLTRWTQVNAIILNAVYLLWIPISFQQKTRNCSWSGLRIEDWTLEDLKIFAWSDESLFLLFHADGRTRVWKKTSLHAFMLCVSIAGWWWWLCDGLFSWHTLGLSCQIMSPSTSQWDSINLASVAKRMVWWPNDYNFGDHYSLNYVLFIIANKADFPQQFRCLKVLFS